MRNLLIGIIYSFVWLWSETRSNAALNLAILRSTLNIPCDAWHDLLTSHANNQFKVSVNNNVDLVKVVVNIWSGNFCVMLYFSFRRLWFKRKLNWFACNFWHNEKLENFVYQDILKNWWNDACNASCNENIK